MTGSAAIDTNAYAALTHGDEAATDLIASFDPLFMPVVVLGELLYGAGASGRSAENRQNLADFVAECSILDITPGVAEQYALLRVQLRAVGRPIPDNDAWIAATCLAAGIPLITRDAHFAHVPDLEVVSW